MTDSLYERTSRKYDYPTIDLVGFFMFIVVLAVVASGIMHLFDVSVAQSDSSASKECVQNDQS